MSFTADGTVLRVLIIVAVFVSIVSIFAFLVAYNIMPKAVAKKMFGVVLTLFAKGLDGLDMDEILGAFGQAVDALGEV